MPQKSEYNHKYFSILGDSISTLYGCNPNGYNIYYEDIICERSGVHNAADTWWQQVIDFFGGSLLVNNSWSGSRVTKEPDNKNLFPSGCSDERTGALGSSGISPDVIIVYLGTNDWVNGVKPESENNSAEIFAYAYKAMLKKLTANYPNAEIWCMTMCKTYMSVDNGRGFENPDICEDINTYNNIIRKLAVECAGCRLIDIYKYNTPFDTIDGTHPNLNGMKTLSAMVIDEAVK